MIIGIVSIVLPVLALILQCVFAGFSILCIPSIVTAVFAALAFWKKGPVCGRLGLPHDRLREVPRGPSRA